MILGSLLEDLGEHNITGIKNACTKIMYVNELLTSLNLIVNSNCREKIKDFVVHGFESSILPLPVRRFYPDY